MRVSGANLEGEGAGKEGGSSCGSVGGGWGEGGVGGVSE